MESYLITPLKFESVLCFICKSAFQKYHLIQNKDNLRQLILKYIDFNVLNGWVCESCQSKLFTIERKCNELKKLYNAESKRNPRAKRLFNSPLKEGRSEK